MSPHDKIFISRSKIANTWGLKSQPPHVRLILLKYFQIKWNYKLVIQKLSSPLPSLSKPIILKHYEVGLEELGSETSLYTYLQTCGDLVLLTACVGVAYKHTVKLHCAGKITASLCRQTSYTVPANFSSWSALEAHQLSGQIKGQQLSNRRPVSCSAAGKNV